MILESKILSFINSHTEQEFDSFYVYDKEQIRTKCRMFRQITYPNKSIHFASMANVHPAFLAVVKEEKLNVFVNSLIHLEEVTKAGFSGDDIIFTSSALTEKAMKRIESFGVQVNLDSPGQLEQWKKLFPNKRVGIRCNIGDRVKPYSNHAGTFIGKESRLGFTETELEALSDKSFVKGLHLYVGTDIVDIDYFKACYKELIALASDFSDLEYLNFGGGFGVAENGDPHFDISAYDEAVTKLMNEFSEKSGRSIRLMLEPGRIIGGTSGYFVCCVTDTKIRPELRLAGVNASTVQFPRPLMYPDTAKHPVVIIRNGEQMRFASVFPTTVYGCSTYSRDIFSKEVELPELHIGDILVYGNAGSYSASSYMEFLGFPKPEEYFIE